MTHTPIQNGGVRSMASNIRSWAWQNPTEVREGRLPPPHWWNRGEPKELVALEKHLVELHRWEGWKLVLRLTNGQLVYVRQGGRASH